MDGAEIPAGEGEQKRLLRSLLNIRPPLPAGGDFLEVQDAYLREETRRKGITDIAELKPVQEGLYLWQRDIATLRCGAIVNAANARMLGCFAPCHGCIDNAIHTFAGVQLRLACAELMRRQEHEEETGGAKITPAFNLPSRYVLHTAGPIVHGRPTRRAGRRSPPATAPASPSRNETGSKASPSAASPPGNSASRTGRQPRSPSKL